MREILQYIDDQIGACFADIQAMGLAHLVEDDSAEIYPATLEEQSKKICPDDRYEFLYYHRLLDSTPEPSEELSFGRKITVKNSQKIRTIVFARMKCDSLTFIDDFINALPDTFELDQSPAEYKMLSLQKGINLNRDSNAVWADEYSAAYKDKYQKIWNIYALEYNIDFIKCPICA